MVNKAGASDKIEFIQGLRGIAALSVVLYHNMVYLGGNTTGSIANILLMPGGSMGVDLFFIISGFIMVFTTWNERGSIYEVARFFAKRVSRIVPVYFVILVMSVIVMHGPSYFLYHHNLIAMIKQFAFQPQGQVNDPPYYGDAPLTVGWTLNYEMYFYLIFGLSMLFGRWLRWIALAAVSAMTLICYPLLTRGQFSTNVYGIYNFQPFYVNLITNPIIWLFMAGVAIGIIYNARFSIQGEDDKTLFSALSICSIGFVGWQYLSQYQMNHGIFLWGMSLAPMVLLMAMRDKAERIIAPTPLSFLGKISFSLYLVHVPVREGIARLINIPEKEGHPALFATSVLVAIGIATLSQRFLEQRLSRFIFNVLMQKYAMQKSDT